jgi:CRP-like cAMP-binding protein
MATGDRFGTFSLLTGDAQPLAVVARRPATLAVIDRAAFTAVVDEFPAVALPLAREIATEVGVRDDFLRQLLELCTALIAAAGLAGLRPLGRRALRGLAFVFGLGAGLVFDEFALFWNLDPEYAQGLSVIAAGLAAATLLQLIYFRNFWRALARRAWLGVRGTR